jgi:hypothetical protein
VSVRSDVEILRPAAEDEVADAAADEIRGVPVLVEAIQDPKGLAVDVTARNRVIRARNNDGYSHETPL